MITKPAVCERVVEKRKKWSIFEELNETNEVLDEAVCILDNLKLLIRHLPGKLHLSVERDASLVESVMILDTSIDKSLETVGVHFDEIESKLNVLQKTLLHDETHNMPNFSKLVSEIRCSQKVIDTLVSNIEEEIYRFLESQGLYEESKKTDIRIMDLVLNIQ